jgi:zinc/manganese transport system substrate-binding protein
MRLTRRNFLAAAAGTPIAGAVQAAPEIRVVAAENMYGDIAGQLGGGLVSVSSIISNPNQDPHLFAASPSVARNLANAGIVIVNGADYDPWMAGLLASQPTPGRVVITVADLLGRKPGDNPHLWYDPAAMPALAKALLAALVAKDPANAATYRQNNARLLASLAPIYARIAALRKKFDNAPVTATEPVYGLMAGALGLTMYNQRFQLAVMNGTEPAPSDIAAFEAGLRENSVRILFYNDQATDDLTANLREIATQSGVAVIGVSETEPAGETYQTWINSGLDEVDRALTR